MKSVPSLPASPWAWHQRELVRLREILARERDERAAALRAPLARGGEDAGDSAANQTERTLLLAELRAEESELAEIEAALERIRRGTYGVCELTGEPIDPARLRAVPWARFARPPLAPHPAGSAAVS